MAHRLLRTLPPALVAALLPLAGLAQPAAAVAGPGGSCAWFLPLNSSGANALAIDQNVTYWVTRVPYVPGESLTLHGRYPHSRYMSVTAYDPRTRGVSSLYDSQVQPDAGSANPFVAGASRTATIRDWTMKVEFLQPGQQPSAAANTLSTGFMPGAATPASDFFLVYRVYRPDQGLDQAGGEPLPAVSADLPATGPQAFPGCPAGTPAPGSANDAIAAAAAPSLPPDPSSPEPAWHRFFNFPTAAAQSPDSTGKTTFAGTVTPYTMRTGSGGYLEDLENAYLYAFLNQGGGPLTVIHARAMTYPDTFGGAATMPGPSDVRYWSVCSYDPATQRNLACQADDRAAPGGGDFTIVVSTPANRPADLCGATWLPYGPNLQSLLIFRNMLGTAPYTVQNVKAGQESAMGSYYPAATYMDQASYRHRVCGIPDAAAGAPPGSDGSAGQADQGGGMVDTGAVGAGFGSAFYGGGDGGFLPTDFMSGPGADGAPADASGSAPADAATTDPSAPDGSTPIGAALAAHAVRPAPQNPALAISVAALIITALGVATRRRLLAP